MSDFDWRAKKIEKLRETWPYMFPHLREAYAKEEPEMFARSGLAFDDPFAPRIQEAMKPMPVRGPVTEEEMQKIHVELLLEDWPGLERDVRENYARQFPLDVELAGVSLDDPYVPRREVMSLYERIFYEQECGDEDEDEEAFLERMEREETVAESLDGDAEGRWVTIDLDLDAPP